MKLMLRVYGVLALIALLIPAGQAQTVTGAQAQKSPQADAFLAYEKALIAGGIDAARQYMTPEKLEELNSMIKNWGEQGFQQFLGRMRGGAQGEARRKQVEKVDVKGDYALLEARDSPNVVTVQHLARTRDGWKVNIRR